MARKPKYTVKATRTSFQIIAAVRERDGAGVTELAEHLDLSKSAVHKHLQTLTEMGYLAREGHAYHVGLRFLQLGLHARSRVQLYEIARPEVERLAGTTGERVSLLVEEGGRGIYLFSAAADGGSPLASPEGEHVALQTVAAGKAILAHLPADRVAAIACFASESDEGDRSEALRSPIQNELQTVHEHGLAFDRGEGITGRRGVAAPIRDSAQAVVGAIEIVGPEGRMSGKRLEEDFAGLVLSTVTAIETALGAR